MEESQAFRLMPRHADDPVPLIFWSVQEFIVIIAILGVGFVMNVWGVGFLGSAAAVWGLRQLKRGAKRGAAQHWIWRKGVNLDRALSATAPPPWTTEFIE